MSQIRYSVRIRLNNFLGTKYELPIIEYLHSIAKQTDQHIFLKLWYNKEDLTQQQVEEFIAKYETLLEDIGVNIHVGEHETWSQRSWFNIYRIGEQPTVDCRYSYKYKEISGIIEGLLVFKEMVMALSKPKEYKQNRIATERGNGSNHKDYKIVYKRVPSVQLRERESNHAGSNSGKQKMDKSTKN